MIMALIPIIFILMLSALFSGTEIAFISANKLKIELLKNKGRRRAKILVSFFEKPAHFLGTLLVGNNIALVAFTSLMTALLSKLFLPLDMGYYLLLFINTIIITVIVLIFGEFLPKTLFRLFSNEILYTLVYPLRVLQFILIIPATVMIRLSNFVLAFLFRMPIEETATAFTRLDLENLVNNARQSSDEEEIDKELFGRALNLKDVKVKNCMIPRTEIVHVDINDDVPKLNQIIKETKLSRVIVVNGDIDEVVGYVHHRQLLNNPKSIQSITLNISFIPEVMRVTDVLNLFIKNRMNIVCVVDEFGGIAGIVTLEDLLEEIFGEIEDEYDQGEHLENQISEDEYVFSGRLEIDYLNEKYEKLSLPTGDYHTLSGYLVMTLENIPDQGAEVILDGYKYILEIVSDTKIELVRIIRMDKNGTIE